MHGSTLVFNSFIPVTQGVRKDLLIFSVNRLGSGAPLARIRSRSQPKPALSVLM